MKTWIFPIAIAMLLAGCATTDPDREVAQDDRTGDVYDDSTYPRPGVNVGIGLGSWGGRSGGGIGIGLGF